MPRCRWCRLRGGGGGRCSCSCPGGCGAVQQGLLPHPPTLNGLSLPGLEGDRPLAGVLSAHWLPAGLWRGSVGPLLSLFSPHQCNTALGVLPETKNARGEPVVAWVVNSVGEDHGNGR